MRKRFEIMAARVAFQTLTSKERPADEFAGAFFDIRQKVKELKEKLSQDAKVSLQKTLVADLKDKGYEVLSADFALGQYRGSKFMTSAKLSVKTGSEEKAKKLAGYLQKYSPKFLLKSFDKKSGVAAYNIR